MSEEALRDHVDQISEAYLKDALLELVSDYGLDAVYDQVVSFIDDEEEAEAQHADDTELDEYDPE